MTLSRTVFKVRKANIQTLTLASTQCRSIECRHARIRGTIEIYALGLIDLYDRGTDKTKIQTDKQKDRQTGRQTNGQASRDKTEGWMHRWTGGQSGRKSDTEIDR